MSLPTEAGLAELEPGSLAGSGDIEQWIAAHASDVSMAALPAMVAAGVVYCFFGYPLLRLMIALLGFALAGGVAALLGAWASAGEPIATGVALAVGGLAGAMALGFVYKAGLFAVGGIGGLLASVRMLEGVEEGWVLWAIVGAAVAGGLLALAVQRPALSLATAGIGGFLLSSAGAYALTGGDASTVSDTGRWAILAGWLVLTAAGMSAQLTLTRNQRRK